MAHYNKSYGKQDLIAWIYQSIKVRVDDVKDLGTGVVYCLLINHFHTKTIPESMINVAAKTQCEYTDNLRLFQSGLNRLKCRRRIDIERISKMRFQENWEIIGWLRRFLDNQSNSNDSKQILCCQTEMEKEQEKQNLIQNQKQEQKQKQKLKLKQKQNDQNIFPQRSSPTPGKLSIPKQHIISFPFRNQTVLNFKIGGLLRNGLNTPIGKSSVSSCLIQNNNVGLIERMKDILKGEESDRQKINVLCLLLNIKQSNNNNNNHPHEQNQNKREKRQTNEEPNDKTVLQEIKESNA